MIWGAMPSRKQGACNLIMLFVLWAWHIGMVLTESAAKSWPCLRYLRLRKTELSEPAPHMGVYKTGLIVEAQYTGTPAIGTPNKETQISSEPHLQQGSAGVLNQALRKQFV